MDYEEERAEELLAFVWQNGYFHGDSLCLRDGTKVWVIRPGRRSEDDGPEFIDAEIEAGGTSFRGSVAVHHRSSDWGYHRHNYDSRFDGVMFNIVNEDDRIIRKVDNSILPALILRYPERFIKVHQTLLDGTMKFTCGRYIAGEMTEIDVRFMLERLMVERLRRKCEDVTEVYQRTEESWEETFHVILFRYIGLGRNQDMFVRLARALPYSILCREQGNIRNIEAMVFGVGGFLGGDYIDEYHDELTRLFEDLRIRYNLQSIRSGVWNYQGTRPQNNPVKRLAQLSALINKGECSFSGMIERESFRDLRRMFSARVEKYWRTRYSFSASCPPWERAVPDDSLDTLLINVVIPVMFAYGQQRDDQPMKDRALEMLYEIAPERNRYIMGWNSKGVRVNNALDSQALIQLTTEYCHNKRCCVCPVGIRVLKKI